MKKKETKVIKEEKHLTLVSRISATVCDQSVFRKCSVQCMNTIDFCQFK